MTDEKKHDADVDALYEMTRQREQQAHRFAASYDLLMGVLQKILDTGATAGLDPQQAFGELHAVVIALDGSMTLCALEHLGATIEDQQRLGEEYGRTGQRVYRHTWAPHLSASVGSLQMRMAKKDTGLVGVDGKAIKRPS